MIDWEKPIQLKDGRAARFVGKLRGGFGRGTHIVVYADRYDPEKEWVDTYREDGSKWCEAFGSYPESHIKNIPQKLHREFWVNVYKDGTPYTQQGVGFQHFPTREAAIKAVKEYGYEAKKGHAATVKVVIDCEEGEGL